MRKKIEEHLGSLSEVKSNPDMISLEVDKENLVKVMLILKNEKELYYQQLTDLCAVYYSQFENT